MYPLRRNSNTGLSDGGKTGIIASDIVGVLILGIVVWIILYNRHQV